MSPSSYPSVSLIVPVYNGGPLFRRCVRSLLVQNYPDEKLQIILIDDGSTDGTLEWLTGLPLSPNIVIVRHQENKGRAAARNSGLSHSEGDVIIFLDGDMEVLPDFVSNHVKALSPKDVVAVTGRMIGDPEIPETKLRKYLFKYKKRGARQFGEDQPIPYPYLLTGNMSIKREVLSDDTNFDESFSGYGGEDTLFAYRIWKEYPQGFRYSAGPVSIDLQEYTLDGILENMYQYGKHNFPKLLRENHDMAAGLKAEYITGNTAKKYLGDIFLNRFFLKVGRWDYGFIPWPISNILIRILILGAIRTGYHHSEDFGKDH